MGSLVHLNLYSAHNFFTFQFPVFTVVGNCRAKCLIIFTAEAISVSRLRAAKLLCVYQQMQPSLNLTQV